MHTFVLYIKEHGSAELMYGFHLGTIEAEARTIVEERWAYRAAPDASVPQYEWLRLSFAGKTFATYTGTWS